MKKFILTMTCVFCISLVGVCDMCSDVSSATKEIKSTTMANNVCSECVVISPHIISSGEIIISVTEYKQLKKEIKTLDEKLGVATTNVDILISLVTEAEAETKIQGANTAKVLSAILKLQTLSQVKNSIRSILLQLTGSVKNIKSNSNKK